MKFKKQSSISKYDVYNEKNVKVGEVWKHCRYGCDYWKNSINGYGVNGETYLTRKEASEYLVKNYQK